jgi:ABC-type oligopeptide transport system substrate-binding subunit
MKVLYATLTAVFIILILQSFSNDNVNVFKSLDSSIRRTDSIVCETKKHVNYLNEHHTKDMNEIDSLKQVLNTMKRIEPVRVYTIVHDTVVVQITEK